MATSFVSICLRRFGFSEIEQPFRCMFYVSNSVSNFIHNFAFKFIKKKKIKKNKKQKNKKNKTKNKFHFRYTDSYTCFYTCFYCLTMMKLKSSKYRKVSFFVLFVLYFKTSICLLWEFVFCQVSKLVSP